MKRLLAASLVALSAPLFAQIATPPRPLTDPRSLVSPTDAAARPVPLDDLSFSRTFNSAVWSADGKYFFISTNLTGRYNLWRADAAGSWPVQLTQSDERQSGLATSPTAAGFITCRTRAATNNTTSMPYRPTAAHRST